MMKFLKWLDRSIEPMRQFLVSVVLWPSQLGRFLYSWFKYENLHDLADIAEKFFLAFNIVWVAGWIVFLFYYALISITM